MRYYPLLLDMRQARCLLVGAGTVGKRKLADILESDVSEVLVLDAMALHEKDAALIALAQDARVRYEQRAFDSADVVGCRLVFAATANAEVNAHIAALCAKHGILCNIADAPDESSFIVPARVQCGRISVTLSTQGASPALSRRLREELEVWLGGAFAPLAEFMARVRPLVLALELGTEHNTHLFRSLVDSSLGEALGQRDRIRCETLARELLPPALHPRLSELLHGLA